MLLPLLLELEGVDLMLELVVEGGCHSLHHQRKERVREQHHHQMNLREHRGEQKRNLEVEVKLLQSNLLLLL
jgi:hypothetical protein